ncbi:uncharacterized protein LOC112342743 [Selaginella moellendorffii]|uniref:uncharacterized protein LOC112342743 n=1 Tax=Selaginella moellendorffii TaxID=88036 RepID=UPI000D1C6806|nr:uncharacterized protein LOC112342743 [Selaginella moellendorffii]|eukprot:XP_024520787.1 uncharacterized protein LOC112342743 [Selaginella moellendorffii]
MNESFKYYARHKPEIFPRAVRIDRKVQPEPFKVSSYQSFADDKSKPEALTGMMCADASICSVGEASAKLTDANYSRGEGKEILILSLTKAATKRTSLPLSLSFVYMPQAREREREEREKRSGDSRLFL